MNTTLIILLVGLGLWLLLYKLVNNKARSKNVYNKDERSDSRIKEDPSRSHQSTKDTGIFAQLFSTSSPLHFDEEAITWCADFLAIDKNTLIKILKNKSLYYSHFSIRKRSGGVRVISAPSSTLKTLQKTIYERMLMSVNIHPAATGFRHSVSILQNVNIHLGKSQVLKVDITNFFGSIKKPRVIKAFEKLGYSTSVSQVLAEVCTLDNKLPQGAPTSPILSNIIAFEIDTKLTAFSQKNGLSYTRYADDLTFSGEDFNFNTTLDYIDNVLFKERFIIQKKKTRFLSEKKRKIVTGISISSGKKMTIPKSTKRELRKNIHYILTKGLTEHKRFIGSTDPAYLKRIIGQLSFWHMVEPNNEFVKKSLSALKKL